MRRASRSTPRVRACETLAAPARLAASTTTVATRIIFTSMTFPLAPATFARRGYYGRRVGTLARATPSFTQGSGRAAWTQPLCSPVEASGFLVGSAVFKTVEGATSSLAGSIPVRLRVER